MDIIVLLPGIILFDEGDVMTRIKTGSNMADNGHRHNKSSTSNPELRGGISKPKQPFLLRSASNPGIIIPGADQV